jgi:hypothetical protein
MGETALAARRQAAQAGWRGFLAGLVLAAAGAAAAAQGASGMAMGAGVESMPGATASWAEGSDPAWAFGSTTTATVDLGYRGPGEGVSASAGASFEASILTGAAVDAALALAALGRLPADALFAPDLAEAAASDSGVLAAFRVRTAWARLDWGWASFTAGRQILNYGRGAVWSPVDIFSSLETRGLSTTRRGIDALRLKAALGATGLLDLVAAPGNDPDAGTYSLRASGLLAPGLDAGAFAAWSGVDGEVLAGADFKLDLGASFHGEALWIRPAGADPAGNDDRLRASGGLDWSAGDFIFLAEYYWNGGVAAAEDPFFAGAHNLYGALSWQASDFLVLNASLTWAVAEDSGSAQLVASWDAAQGAKLAAWLRAGRTQGPAPWFAGAGLALTVSF